MKVMRVKVNVSLTQHLCLLSSLLRPRLMCKVKRSPRQRLSFGFDRSSASLLRDVFFFFLRSKNPARTVCLADSAEENWHNYHEMQTRHIQSRFLFVRLMRPNVISTAISSSFAQTTGDDCRGETPGT